MKASISKSEHSFLKNLARISGVQIAVITNEALQESIQEGKQTECTMFGTVPGDHNPLTENRELQFRMIQMGFMQKTPVISEDMHEVLFACVPYPEGQVLIGPAFRHRLSPMELHHFYRDYDIPAKNESPVHVIPFRNFLSVIELCALQMTQTVFTDRDIIVQNHIDAEQLKIMDTAETESAETGEFGEEIPYDLEKALCQAMADGDEEKAQDVFNRIFEMVCRPGSSIQKAREYSEILVGYITRTVLDCGIPQTEALRWEKQYGRTIQKARDFPSLIRQMHSIVYDITEQIERYRKTGSYSMHCTRALDYIAEHYQEKVGLSEIAEALGINASYLSRLFSREMHMTVVDYITYVRIDHAKNLLRNSRQSIAEIGTYVSFPNASYFSRTFRKETGLTPQQYRNSTVQPRHDSSISGRSGDTDRESQNEDKI